MTMKNDVEVQRDVMDQLKWEPGVNPARIGVTVDDGVVTLSGNVDSYSEKLAAERAAERVFGVEAVVQKIEVRLPAINERTDADIARATAIALEWNVSVPHGRVKVTVQNGWITLSGEVDAWYQKGAAENAVCNLLGVRGVTNGIIVKAKMTSSDVKTQIEKALLRIARLDAQRITVEARGGKVILQGTVRSLAEKDEAERAACAAPGICEIENKIVVSS
jgi:osmotically-inducible protein OsmY